MSMPQTFYFYFESRHHSSPHCRTFLLRYLPNPVEQPPTGCGITFCRPMKNIRSWSTIRFSWWHNRRLTSFLYATISAISDIPIRRTSSHSSFSTSDISFLLYNSGIYSMPRFCMYSSRLSSSISDIRFPP